MAKRRAPSGKAAEGTEPGRQQETAQQRARNRKPGSAETGKLDILALLPPRLGKWLGTLTGAWAAAKNLFHYERVDAALGKGLEGQDFRAAMLVFVLSGIVAFAITSLTVLEFTYLANFISETVVEATGEPMETISLGSLVPVFTVNFFLAVPFGILFDIALAAAAFSVLRLSGGSGTLHGHMYLSSLVSLAFAMATALSLFTPLPCLQLIAGIAMGILEIYLLVYVLGRAYVAVHGVGLLHALAVAIPFFIGRLFVMALVANAVAALAGLPPPVPMDIMGGADAV